MKIKFLLAVFLFIFNLSDSYSQTPFYFSFSEIVNTCDNEPVLVVGTYQFMGYQQVSQGGVYHGHYSIKAKGQGIGLWTGNKYVFHDIINEVVHESGSNSSLNGTFNQQLRLIGQGKAGNLILNNRFHVTVNANGELIVYDFDFTDNCN